MKLTREEKKICNKYKQPDNQGKIQCIVCPLIISIEACICKANVSKEFIEKYLSRNNED